MSVRSVVFQDSLELELGASATGVHKIPAPGGVSAPAAGAPSNVLDPQARARRLKHKSSSGSKEASGRLYFTFDLTWCLKQKCTIHYGYDMIGRKRRRLSCVI